MVLMSLVEICNLQHFMNIYIYLYIGLIYERFQAAEADPTTQLTHLSDVVQAGIHAYIVG